jgi:hypothetical protein
MTISCCHVRIGSIDKLGLGGGLLLLGCVLNLNVGLLRNIGNVALLLRHGVPANRE